MTCLLEAAWIPDAPTWVPDASSPEAPGSLVSGGSGKPKGAASAATAASTTRASHASASSPSHQHPALEGFSVEDGSLNAAQAYDLLLRRCGVPAAILEDLAAFRRC